MKFAALILAAATAAFVSAQSIPASATDQQLQTVQGQYDNSGFYTPIGTSLAFGFQLQPQALLEVVYGGQVVQNGQALTQQQVAALPQIYVTPTSSSASMLAAGQYTVMLADAAALGNPDPAGYYRHFLANGVRAASQPSGSNLTFPLALTTGVATAYAGPGPAAGEGPHRYAWLVFNQGSSYRAQSGLTSPGHWNVTSYVQQAGLGNPIAASFFTVANGQASYSVPATSAYSATAGSSAAATSALASSSGSVSAAPSGSSTGPAPTASRTGAAGKVTAQLGGLIGAALGLIALA